MKTPAPRPHAPGRLASCAGALAAGLLVATSCSKREQPPPAEQGEPELAVAAGIESRRIGDAPAGWEGALVEVTERYPSGKLYTTRTEIAHGDDPPVRHGPFRVWREDGTLWIEGSYSQGLVDGWYVHHHPNGQKEYEGLFQANRREGAWTEWHANGVQRREGRYERNVEVGPWKGWHENGQLAFEGEMVEGKREGQWVYYSESGEVLPDLSGLYRNNTRVP